MTAESSLSVVRRSLAPTKACKNRGAAGNEQEHAWGGVQSQHVSIKAASSDAGNPMGAWVVW